MMSDSYGNSFSEAGWIQAEKMYLRVLGACLIVAAILGILLGVYRIGQNDAAISAVNIVLVVLFALAGVVSIWWSFQQARIERMIDGFKKSGSGRTYAVVVLQLIVGALFVLEGTTGGIVLGFLGLVILGSAGFLVWRAQQINRFG